MKPVQSVLIDIDGVLCIGGTAIEHSSVALARLRRSGVGIRFVTNTTRQTRASIGAQLRAIGIDVADDEIVTGALAARALLEQRGLRPYLLVHPGLLPEFGAISCVDPDAVVVGDAGDGFSYAALNAAMRILIDRPAAPLIAIARNRYFRAADGLWLDAGPFVAALEYACDRRAELTGKPAPALFRTALDQLGQLPAQAVMIGDDIDSDVAGAQACGLSGILVRTGKYRPSDEAGTRPRADLVVDDFPAAVQAIIAARG